VVELDAYFWSADLVPLDRGRWVAVQGTLAAADDWIMDGDLGPYDVLAPRLARADTVVLLDFALLVACGTPPAGRASAPISGGGS
jgi:hypothetical protein